MGDLSTQEKKNRTPLEVAKTPKMDFLAKNGKLGLMYTVGKGIAPESDVAVVSILGYDPLKYDTSRGMLEAFGSGIPLKDGDLALRCNFATIDQQERIIDRRAGRNLTAEDARKLGEAINKTVELESYPAFFEFKSTIGYRAVLVIRSKDKPLSGKITNTDPAYMRLEGLGVVKADAELVLKRCEAMDQTEEAKISAELVNEFVEKSHSVLNKHEVNKERVTQGKLSANAILTRDAGHLLPKFFDINDRYRSRFVCLADMPVERGISKLAGMNLVDLPQPSGDLKKDCMLRVEKLVDALPSYDCFYIHIKGPDEPGHDGNFDVKTRLIATIDKHFFGNLLQRIKMEDSIFCVTADHATPCKLKAHSDDPVPLLISGNKIESEGHHRFSEKECKKGSLGTLKHGTELMPKLIKLLKSGPVQDVP